MSLGGSSGAGRPFRSAHIGFTRLSASTTEGPRRNDARVEIGRIVRWQRPSCCETGSPLLPKLLASCGDRCASPRERSSPRSPPAAPVSSEGLAAAWQRLEMLNLSAIRCLQSGVRNPVSAIRPHLPRAPRQPRCSGHGSRVLHERAALPVPVPGHGEVLSSFVRRALSDTPAAGGRQRRPMHQKIAAKLRRRWAEFASFQDAAHSDLCRQMRPDRRLFAAARGMKRAVTVRMRLATCHAAAYSTASGARH